jgi:hypothetical protein
MELPQPPPYNGPDTDLPPPNYVVNVTVAANKPTFGELVLGGMLRAGSFMLDQTAGRLVNGFAELATANNLSQAAHGAGQMALGYANLAPVIAAPFSGGGSTAALTLEAPVAGGAGTAAAAAGESTAEAGTQLYRVFGGEARGLGNYYTTVDPGIVGDFRTTAGLFPGNSGSFVLEGILNDTEGVILRTAAPGPGGVGGGLPEVFVPNPATQITITRVSGVNPPF